MRARAWRFLLPLSYMAGLLLLSSIPGDDRGTPVGLVFQWLTPQWQNLLHIPLYAGLATCWLWALGAWPERDRKVRAEPDRTAGSAPHRNARLATALLLTLAWAVVDESYQSTVPGRYGSLSDIALNAIGACLAILVAKRANGSNRHNKPAPGQPEL